MKQQSNRHAFITKLKEASYSHNPISVFSDFCEASAIAISNSVDILQAQEREKRYLQIVRKYEAKHFALFPEMLAHLTEMLEAAPCDALGGLFMDLEFGNKYVGQFFTPYELSKLMAACTVEDPTKAVEGKPFITVQEPALGAGSTVIALCEHFKNSGVNYQEKMHCVGVDVDLRCVHMAYLQLSLLGVPAIIYHGDSLAMKMWSAWYTPMHVFGFWPNKLERRYKAKEASHDETPQVVQQVTTAQRVGQLTLF